MEKELVLDFIAENILHDQIIELPFHQKRR